MTRFTAALGAISNGGKPGPDIQLKLVNLHQSEQLSESYLTTVSPKGQIPALTGRSLERPLTSSAEICDWLCQQYPRLLPDQHRQAINDLLGKMRSFHVLAISVPVEQRGNKLPNPAEALLARDDLSPAHRKALEAKRNFHDQNFGKALDHSNVADTEDGARVFLDGVLHQYLEHNGGGMWIFGDEVGPTVLDGHTVPFINRLLERERSDLLNDELRRYAEGVMGLPEWKSITHGRPTMYNPSMGPAHLLPL